MSRQRPAHLIVQYFGGVVVMGIGTLTLYATMPLRGFHLVSLTSGFSFVAGLMFGWPGVAGVLTYMLARQTLNDGLITAPEHIIYPAILAAGGVLSLRFATRRFGRIISFPTYVTMLFGVLVASLVAAPIVVLFTGPQFTWLNIWFWWATFLSSIVLISPPVLEVLVRLFKRWLAEPWRSRFLEHRTKTRQPQRTLWLDRTLPLMMVGALGLVLTAVQSPMSSSASWIQLLFLVPVAWTAQRSGFHDAALVGCLSGLTILLARPTPFGDPAVWHTAVLAEQAATLIFPLLGATLGWAFERERRVQRQLERVNEEMQIALSNVVLALRSALGAKHAETEDHAVRVSQYAMTTGHKLRMPADELEALETASLLHDIGKIGIPETILNKPGPLTQAEQTAMRRHAEIGARILTRLPGLHSAAPLVLHHQERFDGRPTGQYPGYPTGLTGDDIPLGSRIIAVVDAFDAMTSDRPYRGAMSVDQAIEELKRESGTQFDPQVVEAFLQTLEETPWEPEA